METPSAVPSPVARPPVIIPETYAVRALIGDRTHIGVLEELEPGQLFTSVRVEVPSRGDPATLAIDQLWVNSLLPPRIGEWRLPLRPLRAAGGDRRIVLDEVMSARPDLSDVPPIVRSGYSLTVYWENKLLFGLVSIEVRRGGPSPQPGSIGHERGRYNYCRWDIGPLAAPPRPGTDEADC
jgi:hypothetical protein